MLIAGGVNTRASCSVSAFAVNWGRHNDPCTTMPRSSLRKWLHTLARKPELAEQIEAAWQSKKLKSLKAGTAQTRWLRVRGPISSLVATLCDAGWDTAGPRDWTDHRGQRWQATGALNTKSVEAALFDSLEGHQWEAAAEHRLGSGLQQGACLQPAMTVRATLAPARAHTLDNIVAGGLWFRQRLFEAGRLTTGVCRWCEKEPETEHHIFWECLAAGR